MVATSMILCFCPLTSYVHGRIVIVMSLREARQQAGLTQVALAKRAGVDQTTISDVETGKNRNPSWETVKRISDALGMDPSALFPINQVAA